MIWVLSRSVFRRIISRLFWHVIESKFESIQKKIQMQFEALLITWLLVGLQFLWKRRKSWFSFESFKNWFEVPTLRHFLFRIDLNIHCSFQRWIYVSNQCGKYCFVNKSGVSWEKDINCLKTKDDNSGEINKQNWVQLAETKSRLCKLG